VTADREPARKPAPAKRGRPRSVRKTTRGDASRKRVRDARESAEEYVEAEEREDETEGEDGEEEGEGSVKSKSRKSYSCPFSVARDGARTLCKWQPHADKRSVRFRWGAFANCFVVGETSSRDSFPRLG
jgi:hypothetical protein